jgi:hypothetical protein
MLERIETTTTERDPDTRQPIFRQWSLMPDRFDRRGGPISTSFGSWAFVVLVFTAIIFILALAVHEYSHMEMVRAVW